MIISAHNATNYVMCGKNLALRGYRNLPHLLNIERSKEALNTPSRALHFHLLQIPSPNAVKLETLHLSAKGLPLPLS